MFRKSFWNSTTHSSQWNIWKKPSNQTRLFLAKTTWWLLQRKPPPPSPLPPLSLSTFIYHTIIPSSSHSPPLLLTFYTLDVTTLRLHTVRCNSSRRRWTIRNVTSPLSAKPSVKTMREQKYPSHSPPSPFCVRWGGVSEGVVRWSEVKWGEVRWGEWVLSIGVAGSIPGVGSFFFFFFWKYSTLTSDRRPTNGWSNLHAQLSKNKLKSKTPLYR